MISPGKKPRKRCFNGGLGSDSSDNGGTARGGVGETTPELGEHASVETKLTRAGVVGVYRESYSIESSGVTGIDRVEQKLFVETGVDANAGAKLELICVDGKQVVTQVDAMIFRSNEYGLIDWTDDVLAGAKGRSISGVCVSSDGATDCALLSFHSEQNGWKLMFRLNALISSNTSVESM